MLRTRPCIDPKYGGKPCSGISREEQNCGTTNCPSTFTILINYHHD